MIFKYLFLVLFYALCSCELLTHFFRGISARTALSPIHQIAAASVGGAVTAVFGLFSISNVIQP